MKNKNKITVRLLLESVIDGKPTYKAPQLGETISFKGMDKPWTFQIGVVGTFLFKHKKRALNAYLEGAIDNSGHPPKEINLTIQ